MGIHLQRNVSLLMVTFTNKDHSSVPSAENQTTLEQVSKSNSVHRPCFCQSGSQKAAEHLHFVQEEVWTLLYEHRPGHLSESAKRKRTSWFIHLDLHRVRGLQTCDAFPAIGLSGMAIPVLGQQSSTSFHEPATVLFIQESYEVKATARSTHLGLRVALLKL